MMSVSASRSLSTQQTRQVCWICLDEGAHPAPCNCPQFVHISCLARWQLERLGKREERECRFCSTLLPPWQEALLPQRVKPAPEALVNVHAPDGSLHRIPLQPGMAGRRRFLRAVRHALCLRAHVHLDMSFEVAVPITEAGSRPTMISTRDFSLASHIAAVNAGVRRAKGEAAVASSSLAPPPPPPAGNNLMMASVEKAVVASQAWELQQNMHEAVSLQVQKQATEEQPHECSAQEGEVQRRVGHKARWQVTGQAQEQTQKEMDWVRHVGDRDEEPLG